MIIYKDIKASGRQIWQMTATEEATVRSIAESHTATAYDAQAILLLAYGEEFPIALPALPEFVNEVLQGDLNIVFKNGNVANTVNENIVGEVYPNPTNYDFSFKYDVKRPTDFYFYNSAGQLLENKQLVGRGKYTQNIEKLSNGVYYYILRNAEGIISQQKVVVLH